MRVRRAPTARAQDVAPCGDPAEVDLRHQPLALRGDGGLVRLDLLGRELGGVLLAGLRGVLLGDGVALGGFLGREGWRSRCDVRKVEVADGLDDDAGLVGDVLGGCQPTARD